MNYLKISRLKVFSSILMLIIVQLCLLQKGAYAQSQTIKVSGTVYDASEITVPGASVLIKGTKQGVVTDENGKFSLNVSAGSTLVISSLGFVTQEITVINNAPLSVKLVAEVTNTMDQVVVIGYGKQKKVDLTSAITTVDPKKMTEVPGGFAAVLQSDAPGVQINNGRIRVRGVGSINNTDPLFVVDGMIGGAMPDENNIASVQILKDAASCAIYGSRGANGVILITTKKGVAGPTTIEYNGYGGSKKISHNIDMLNGQQLAELINEEMYNQDPTRTDYLEALSNPPEIGKGYNMQDELLRTGNYQKHALSVSGGSQTAHFRLNGTYGTDKPVIIKDRSKDYSLQFLSDFTLGNLQVGENVKLSYNSRHWGDKNLIDAQKWSSTLPLYDVNNPTGFAGAGNGTDVESALANAYLNSNESESFSANGNVWLTYEFIPGLKYKFNLGVDVNRGRTQGYISTYSVGQYQNHDPDELNISTSQSNRVLYEHTLSYDHRFGKHDISAIVGITSEESNSKGLNGGARALPSSELLILGLTQDADSKVIGSSVGQFAMYSMLGRINYNYDSKYLLTVNFRRDGSGNFSENNRYGNFPSVSAGWRIGQENFMKQFPFISDLKIRGSYGVLGNSDIPQYQYQNTVTFDHVWYYLNGVKVTGALPTNPSNPDVKWESQYSTDLGLDLSMFNNRFELNVDYYNKKTEDMLVNVPISYTAGYIDNFPTLNAGSIRNEGFEFLATYRKTEGRFNYSISANLSTVKNEVLALGNNNEILAGTVNPGGENVTRTAVGSSIGEFWGFVTDGLYKSADQLSADKAFAPDASLGDVRFKDLNGDGALNEDDKAFIGSPIPSFSYGFNLSLAYNTDFGAFDLSAMWQGTQGNEIYNNGKSWGEGMYHYYNDYATVLNRYRAEDITFVNPVSGVTTNYPKNVNTNIPRAILGDPNHNLRASDRFIEDGSYLRLKSLTIGYKLPSRLTNRMKIKSLRFYIGGKNLLTFTNYTGYDPEVGADNAKYNLYRGIDELTPWGLTFPNNKEVFFGAQITF